MKEMPLTGLQKKMMKVNIFQKHLDICYSNVIQYKCKANAYISKEFIKMAKGNWETISHLAQGFSKNKVAWIKNGVNFKIKKGEKIWKTA